MCRIGLLTLVPLALLGGMSTAIAQPQRPCVAVAKQLCGHVFNDVSARQACMMANRSNWSPECKAAMEERVAKVRAECVFPRSQADRRAACVQARLRGQRPGSN
jgi:hypothetical protein